MSRTSVSRGRRYRGLVAVNSRGMNNADVIYSTWHTLRFEPAMNCCVVLVQYYEMLQTKRGSLLNKVNVTVDY